MVQTYNLTFFLQVELWGAMTFMYCLFVTCLLQAHLLGSLRIFNDYHTHIETDLEATGSVPTMRNLSGFVGMAMAPNKRRSIGIKFFCVQV